MSCSARPIQERACERVVRLAEHADLAVGDAQQVADGADQRGLAGAVGAEQAEEGAGRDLEVEVLEGERAVVVALGQAAQLEARDRRGTRRRGYRPPTAAADDRRVATRAVLIVLVLALLAGCARAASSPAPHAQSQPKAQRRLRPGRGDLAERAGPRAHARADAVPAERAARRAAAWRRCGPRRAWSSPPSATRARWSSGTSSITSTRAAWTRTTASCWRATRATNAWTGENLAYGTGPEGSPVEIVDAGCTAPGTARTSCAARSPRSGSAWSSACRSGLRGRDAARPTHSFGGPPDRY